MAREVFRLAATLDVRRGLGLANIFTDDADRRTWVLDAWCAELEQIIAEKAHWQADNRPATDRLLNVGAGGPASLGMNARSLYVLFSATLTHSLRGRCAKADINCVSVGVIAGWKSAGLHCPRTFPSVDA